jgi:hypothetical protein
MPALELIQAETAKLGLPETDAECMYKSWLANGFKNGRGQKIRDWRAAVSVWYHRGYFPSLKKKQRKVVQIEHVIAPPPAWTPPPTAWAPPAVEEVIAHAKTLQRDIRTMPQAATRRAEKLAKYCYAKWVGNKWTRFGQKIDSTEQWKALMVEMAEELNRQNR